MRLRALIGVILVSLILLQVSQAISIGITSSNPSIVKVSTNVAPTLKVTTILPKNFAPGQKIVYDPLLKKYIFYTVLFTKPGVTIAMINIWNGLTKITAQKNYWNPNLYFVPGH